MNVVELPKATVADVPRVLRAVADQIEAGAYGNVTAGVIVLDADQIECFGAGAADFHRALSLLIRGQIFIATKAPE